MYYFAYGSNMSSARLRERVPSAQAIGRFVLAEHDLRYHKLGQDGSSKCDAFLTSDTDDEIHGVLFRIDPAEKPALDKAEGVGHGYDCKEITVTAEDGTSVIAMTYVALRIDENLRPFSWYVNHVLVGAFEASLPMEYIETKITPVEVVHDADKARDAEQRAIHE